MRVVVHHRIERLRDDLIEISRKAPRELRATVREGLRIGNGLAKENARKTSGRHARQYPSKFTTEMYGQASTLSGGGLIAGEYGPEHRGQGELDGILENGSQNNKAHRNLTRSQDVIGPALHREVRELVDGWFW